MNRTYYLHVTADCSEQQFEIEPKDILSLRVERIGDKEFTRTWNKSPFFTVPEVWSVTPPPGKSWILHENHEPEHFSIWRRRAARKVL